MYVSSPARAPYAASLDAFREKGYPSLPETGILTATVPGAIATLVFAMPPAVRLTNLGIRQVSSASSLHVNPFDCACAGWVSVWLQLLHCADDPP